MSKKWINNLILDSNKSINLKVNFPNDFIKNYFLSTEIIPFYKRETISKSLNKFAISRGKYISKNDYFCYLSRNKKVIKKLSKEKPISELNLNELDMIIISYKELKTEEDSNNLDITYNSNIIPWLSF